MLHIRTLVATALAVAIVSSTASATAVGVSPLRLTLKANQQATGIFLTNANPTSGPYQIEVMRWTQVDGKDVLTPAESIVSSPSITTVPAHSRQIVRILETRPVKPGSSYRVLVKQLPTPAMEKQAGLKYLLTISIPLFVGAPDGATAKLTWQQLSCHWHVSNSGAVAARITDVSVNGKAVVPGLLGYVLPNSTMDFAPSSCSTTGSLHATVNGQPFTAGE